MKESTAVARGMQPVKKNNAPLILVKDDDERVYDGEIIEEDEIGNRDREKAALVKKQETTPVRQGFAFNLGKFAGSLISSVGLLGKVINRFQSGKSSPGRRCDGGGGRGGGRGGRRQRKGKRCFER
ncbi:MAG: hypothetical protein QG657_1349 [Acidobacteriota bacterium]|nr:hypothetical protein [Acidobacteriota bacterium]